jgi:hypothetical protein
MIDDDLCYPEDIKSNNSSLQFSQPAATPFSIPTIANTNEIVINCCDQT